MPTPVRPTRADTPESVFTIGSESSAELMTARDMEIARGEAQDTPRNINCSTNIASMSAESLKFQLFLRGVDVDDPEYNLPTKRKGKGGGKTEKQYYADIANDMIRDGRWQTRIEEQLLRSRIANYKRLHQEGVKINL